MKPEQARVDDKPSEDGAKRASNDSHPGLGPMLEKIRSLEKWYAADFERRVSSITELLKTQVTEELRAERRRA